MVSAHIKVSFEFPEEEAVQTGLRPFIYLDTVNLVDAAIEGGVPDHSPVIGLIHQAGECLDVQDLLEGYVMSHVVESRSSAAFEVAEWLEAHYFDHANSIAGNTEFLVNLSTGVN